VQRGNRLARPIPIAVPLVTLDILPAFAIHSKASASSSIYLYCSTIDLLPDTVLSDVCTPNQTVRDVLCMQDLLSFLLLKRRFVTVVDFALHAAPIVWNYLYLLTFVVVAIGEDTLQAAVQLGCSVVYNSYTYEALLSILGFYSGAIHMC